MTRPRSRLAAGCGLAALVICAAAGGAGAAGLVKSRDIADGSIRSVDVRDVTLAGRDFKDASLSARDFAGGLPDTTPGPDRILTWSGTYTADGSTGEDTPLVVSSDIIPAGSLIRASDMNVTGDYSGCAALDIAVVPPASGFNGDMLAIEVLRSADEFGPADQDVILHDLVTLDAPTHLAIAGLCLSTGDNAVPSFDFTVTFSVTQLDLPPTTTWN